MKIDHWLFVSGHSKWSQIKHKKAVTDQKRGQLFGKLSRAISIAAKNNPDPKMNFQLRSVIDKAKRLNMPISNIERILQKIKSNENEQLDELLIEVIVPGNIALLITAITDNKNRTMGELRAILSDYDARIADQGSVVWMFKKVGVIIIDCDEKSLEEIAITCIESGAEDVNTKNKTIIVTTDAIKYMAVHEALSSKGLNILSGELCFIPMRSVPADTDDAHARIKKLITVLEEHADVENVYTNESIN